MDPKNLPIKFPSDVLRWMKGNAAPKMSLKLMQLCKYFQFQEFPFTVVRSIYATENKWLYRTIIDGFNLIEELNLENLPTNFWIIESLQLKAPPNLLIPKISVFDISYLIIDHQSILFDEFKILIAAGKVKSLFLKQTLLFKTKDVADNQGVDGDEDDDVESDVSIEEILMSLPKLERFSVHHHIPPINSLDSLTSVLPLKLRYFELFHIPYTFNFDQLFQFIQKHRNITFQIRTRPGFSKEMTQKVQDYVDELIEGWSPEYLPPTIDFPRQSKASRKALEKLHINYNSRLKNDH